MMRLRPFLTALLLILTLAGCTPKPPEKAPEVTTIRILGDDPYLDGVINAFYSKHSNIRVEKVPYATDVGQEINLTEIFLEKLKQNEADVFPIMADLRGPAEVNLLLALDPYIKKSKLDMKPYESLLSTVQAEGRTYALPVYVYPRAILYNVDMFERQGVAPPKPGWTWEDFRTAAGRFTSGTGESKVWGAANDFGFNSLPWTMYYQRLGREPVIDPQAAKEIFQYWATLVETDKSVTPSPKLGDNGRSDLPATLRRDFQKGRAAMTITTVTSYTYDVRGVTFRWEMAPIPVMPGGKPVVSISPQRFGIAAASPNANAAWTFLQFLAGEEGAVALAKGGQLPVRRTDAVRQAWFDRTPAPSRGTEFFLTAELRADPLVADTKSGRIQGAFFRALQGVMQGGADWEALYRQFVSEREKILSEP